jgi:nucleoside-diphosphate-sugar epimerase
MSKIYVFGSSGFIGRSLCESLRKAGHKPIEVELDSTLSELSPYSLVIYLASSSQHSRTTSSAIADLSHLDSVFQMASRSKSTVWMASSSSVSGGNTPHACYAKWAEILAAHYRATVRSSFLRIYSVYGLGQHDNLIHRSLNAGIKGQTLTVQSGQSIRDWIHVSDVVDYIQVLVEMFVSRKSTPPVMHIGTGRGLPVNVAVDIIEDMIDCKIHRVQGHPIANEPLVSVAQKIIPGWVPKVTFEHGIRDTYLSYVKQHRSEEQPGGTEETGSEVHCQGNDQETQAPNGCGSL